MSTRDNHASDDGNAWEWQQSRIVRRDRANRIALFAGGMAILALAGYIAMNPDALSAVVNWVGTLR